MATQQNLDLAASDLSAITLPLHSALLCGLNYLFSGCLLFLRSSGHSGRAETELLLFIYEFAMPDT